MVKQHPGATPDTNVSAYAGLACGIRQLLMRLPYVQQGLNAWCYSR